MAERVAEGGEDAWGFSSENPLHVSAGRGGARGGPSPRAQSGVAAAAPLAGLQQRPQWHSEFEYRHSNR